MILRDRLYSSKAKQDVKAFYCLLDDGLIEKHAHKVKGYNYSITAKGLNVLAYYEQCMREELKKVGL